MKIGVLFEWMFQDSHCDSEFAHMCLFVLLSLMLYYFLQGVREQLIEKDKEQKRKEEEKQAKRQNQQKANPMAEMVNSSSRTAGQERKYSIQMLAEEEPKMNEYKFCKDQENLANTYVHVKKNTEGSEEKNSLFRLDMVSDLHAPKHIFEILKDWEQYKSWFGDKITQYKLEEVQAETGTNVYSMIIELSQPIGKREVIFKRYVQHEEKKNVFNIVYCSLDLEKTYGRESPSGIPRVYFGQPSGIVMKPNQIASAADINQNYSKIYFGFALDFGKQEVTAESQLQIIPDFMLDFMERASCKAAALQPIQ